jgi:hypothetical protein
VFGWSPQPPWTHPGIGLHWSQLDPCHPLWQLKDKEEYFVFGFIAFSYLSFRTKMMSFKALSIPFLRRPTFLVCVPFDFLRENRYLFHAFQYLSSLTAAVIDGLAFNAYFKVHKTKGRTLFVVYV